MADVITELDADIYNLNEVEDCEVLHDLLELLPKNHGYRFYLVNGEDVSTGNILLDLQADNGRAYLL